MKTPLFPITALILGISAVVGCSGTESNTSESSDTSESAATGIENVQQYNDCTNDFADHGDGELKLAKIAPGPTNGADTGGGQQGIEANVAFRAASCIVNHVDGHGLQYVIQSYKISPTGERIFFFKRARDNRINEPASECLKIKMSVVIGATDPFITIHRVKKLPSVGTGLCSDNGET